MKSALCVALLLAAPVVARGVPVAVATDMPIAAVAAAAGQPEHDFVPAGTPITVYPGNLDVSARLSTATAQRRQ